MVILQDALEGLKGLLRAVELSDRARTAVIRCVAAFVLHAGRMSASQAAGAIRTEQCHRAQIGRFLKRAWWQKRGLLKHLQYTVLAMESRSGSFMLIVDSTFCSQQGRLTENTFSTGNRQRRPRQGRRYNSKKNARKCVHGFVCGLLVTPSGMRIPFVKKYLTKDTCKKRGVKHRTQTELAAEIIAELELPRGAKLIVLGDTAFDADSIRGACEKHKATWITPVNPERVLAGAKPRPKVRSLLEKFKPQQFVAMRLHPGQGKLVPYRRLSPHRVGPKAKVRTFYVHGERRAVHSVGEVLLVVSTTEKPQRGKSLHEPKLLMSNDTSLTPQRLVELYALRWQIELFFKELKSTLGLHQYRFKDFRQVEHWVDLVLVTFLYLEWNRARQLARSDLADQQRRWWESQRTHGLCHAVRHSSELRDLFTIRDRLKTPNGIRKLARVLRNGLPVETRNAM
jgi:hypothetical protein